MKDRKTARKIIFSVLIITTLVTAYVFSPLSSTVNGGKSENNQKLKNEIFAKDNGDKVSGAVTVSGSDALGAGDSEKKEETVYVVTDSTGDEDDVIVSDYLTNKTKSDKIIDKTDLKKIKNVKGKEKFKRSKTGKVIWKARGNSINYQGKTDKELPVGLEITYKLNRKEISGSEIQGRSGDVEIKIKYSNRAIVDVDGISVRVPFIALTGILTESSSLTDVKVSSGKVIEEGDKLIIGAIAMPGMSKNTVSSSGLDISDEVVITGKAEKFNITDMMTIVTGNILDDVDGDNLSGIGEIDSKVKLLDSSGKKLEDAAKQLYGGVNMLYKNADTFKVGVSAIKKGADNLKKGIGKYTAGTKQLEHGARLYGSLVSENLIKLRDASLQLEDGADNLYAGLNKLKKGVDGDGTDEDPGLVKGLYSVTKGNLDIYKGLVKVQKGLNGDDENMGLTEGAKEVWNGTKKISDVGDKVKPYVEKGNELTKEIKEKIDQYYEEGLISERVYESLTKTTDKVLEYGESAEGKLNELDDLSSGAEKVYNGIQEIADGMNGENGLVQGSKDATLGAYSLYKGSLEIKKGLDGDGTKGNPGLVKGAFQLKNGIWQLSEGIYTVDKNKDSIISGAMDIADGAKELQKSQEILYTGAKALATGMNQLEAKSGVLTTGIVKLNDGSKALSAGMTEFYKTGIKQLIGFYNKMLGDAAGNIEVMVKAGKEYNTFSDKTADREGSVKFIYKTAVDESR